ncbi:YggT family protein [Xylophilus rhododendri]|uniref:YggT family protein n=1 Tax=Xylophilus rhododendri TaxID=2697032 RepID=A0A857JDH3_9BURK|nr:YggT family protein [Xylophilus rhododendri]QHJ01688.1 YggT family protein [Xylophilus rhododendri]
MLYQIVSFLLDALVSVVGGACLVRFVMQRQRVPFSNPVGRLVMALSDWIVLKLRKVVPSVGGWDTSSLLAAYLLVLAKLLLLWGLLGARAGLGLLPVVAVFGTVQLAISMFTALLVIFAILSWVQPQSPVMPVIDRICAPLLNPLRRALPQVGGFDFSPLVLLLILQVLGMLLNALQGEVLGRL